MGAGAGRWPGADLRRDPALPAQLPAGGGGQEVRRDHVLHHLRAGDEPAHGGLAAQRGGVQTSDAAEQIDGAVDTQIELEVLLHQFATGEDSSFVAKYKEGLEHADAALGAGQGALGELAFRRRGLAISLIIILLVLIGLGLKIRQLSDRRTDEPEPSS